MGAVTGSVGRMQARAGSVASSRTIRFALALPLVLVIMAMTFAAGMRPASAHAVVTSSKPADGEQLKTAPSDVTINFSETISSDLGGLKVLDAAGNRVDQNDSSQPTPSSLRTTLKPGLADGTFIANYKVVSADGHAISGAIVFAVGNAKIGDVSSLEAKNDPAMEILSRVGQFLTYVGALLAAGLAFFLAYIHDGAADRTRLQSITRWSSIVAALGIVVTVLAQAALATGGGLGSAFQSGTIGPVLRQGLGWSAAVLFVGLAAVHLSVDLRRTVFAQSMAFYGGLAVAGSFVLWGHSIEADDAWLAIPADIVHVACAAAWFGGLVGLLFVLRARCPSLAAADGAQLVSAAGPATLAAGVSESRVGVAAEAAGETSGEPTAGPSSAGEGELGDGGVALLTRPADGPSGANASAGPAPTGAPERPSPAGTGGHDAAPGGDDGDDGRAPGSLAATVHMVQRFSTMAAISVVLLALAGTALGYSELGSFSALLTTTYGLTLTVKLALVAVVLFMAGYNRYFLLPWLFADDESPAAGPEASPDSSPDSSPEEGAGSGGEPGGSDAHRRGAAHGANGSVTAVTPNDARDSLAAEVPVEARGAAVRSSDEDAPPPSATTTTAGSTAADEAAGGWRTLVRTLVFEAVGIVAILAVTAVLVNVTPGLATAAKVPYQASKPFRDGKVSITIAPNSPGPNNIHLDFTGTDGRPSDVAQKVTLELSLPAKDIGPFTREFVKAGTGHFILENINDISIAGDWQVTLLVRVSDFDQERVEFQDTVT